MELQTQSLRKASLSLAGRLNIGLRQVHSNNQARSVLRSIESQQGPTNGKAIAHANQYAQEVLGSATYAPWLHVYTAINGTFTEGWIPDNYYAFVVGPNKGGAAAGIVNVKSFTNRVLRSNAIPDIAYSLAGVFYSRDFRPMRTKELTTVLFDGQDRIFFKADGSCQGKAVWILTRDDFKNGPPEFPDGVFQSPIRQHQFFSGISPNSTATLRMTTAKEPDGSVAIKAAYIRGGRSVDRFVSSQTHVRVPLDKHTGELSETGYMHDWRKIDRHPDTGFRFAGNRIPHFDNIVALCKSLHESCPHFLCVGWDTCVNEDDQVEIMEWNAQYNDIKFSEATTGPCFSGLGWEDLWKTRVS